MGNIHALNCCTNPTSITKKSDRVAAGNCPSSRSSRPDATFAGQSPCGDKVDQTCMTDVEHMPRGYSWEREFPSPRANIDASHGFVNQAHTLHQHSSTPSTSEPPSSSHDVQSPGNETEQPSLRNVGVRNENRPLNFRVHSTSIQFCSVASASEFGLPASASEFGLPSSGLEASEFGLRAIAPSQAIARSHQMRRRKGRQKLTHLEPSSSGDIDEALSSDYLWEQVFLSYSAKQRAVVEQLYIDLTRASISCFFDRRSFSEGQRFNPPRFEAPKTCEVAIVVVSEDYIASELAMLQLCAFVQAEKTVNSKLRIYPLFYGMSPDEFSQRIDYIKEKGFPESWSRFANFSQRSTGFMSLLEALEALRSYEKPLYVQNDGMADYRHKLLCDVHRLLSPNIKGKERLCQVVANLFKQAPRYNDGVKVIGLYGIDGSGKTTLCKSLCGFYFDDFKGKVFHAGFHKQGLPVETLKGLLQTLTDANEESVNLVGNYEQALSLLKQQMSNQRVFLCLDNIPDRLKSVKEAQAYLTAGFGMGSLVLLTAGSMEILERVIPEARKRSFVRVPNLSEEEAIDVLINLSEVKARNLTSEERYKAAEYAYLCCFGEGMSCKEGSYHPLALTVLGAYLCEKVSCNPSQWLPTPGFSEYPNAQEFMFHIIEQTINAFDPVSLRILLLLIFSVPNMEFVLNFNHFIFRWIADVCPDESNQSVRDAIYGMKIRGLLEGRGRNSISFHNTVVEFGKSKLKEMKQSLSLEGKDEVPNAVASSVVKVLKLKNYTPSRTFPFNQFRNVSVVHLERVCNLETLNFESMRAVRSITIVECYALREIRGLCGLSSPLRFLKVEGCEALVQCPEIGGLKQLRHLHMQLEADIDKILRVGLESCFCLEEIYLDGICYVSVPRRLRRVRSVTLNNSHYCVVPLDFTDCLKLQWIKLWNCSGGYPSLNLTRCINVRSIYVRKNDDITEIVGLDELIALEELHLIDMNSIEKLPSFRQLENLSHLTLQNMAKLKELPDLSNCHRLQNVDIDSKLLYMMCPN